MNNRFKSLEKFNVFPITMKILGIFNFMVVSYTLVDKSKDVKERAFKFMITTVSTFNYFY